MRDIFAAGRNDGDRPLTFTPQDDPTFPESLGGAIDDTVLERSWRLRIETVPTLIRFEAEREPGLVRWLAGGAADPASGRTHALGNEPRSGRSDRAHSAQFVRVHGGEGCRERRHGRLPAGVFPGGAGNPRSRPGAGLLVVRASGWGGLMSAVIGGWSAQRKKDEVQTVTREMGQ